MRVRLYLDADLKRTIDISGIPLLMKSGQSMRIGNSYGSEMMHGLIDDVRVYKRSLSVREIQILAGLERAHAPDPADGATGVSRTPTLSWSPGLFGAEVEGNKLYFSSDATAVVNRTASMHLLTDPTYSPGTLEFGETYYWAVDTVNDPCSWSGHLWSFTVIGSIIVDDMESYGDGFTPGQPGNCIFFVWRDGWTLNEADGFPAGFLSNNTGASIGKWNPPYAETTIVSGGSQSMPYLYDNDGEVLGGGTFPNPDNPLEQYSKAKAEISDLQPLTGIDPNWLANGVKTLALRFWGSSMNDPNETMWVELTDDSGTTARVSYGPPHLGEDDVNDVRDESWHQWNIDLQEFVDNNGVNLTEVNSIAIGFGDPSVTPPPGGGTGTIYVDDIRLYVPRCVPEKRDPSFAALDYVSDCVIDGKELEIMAANWLGAVPTIVPVTVPDAGFDDHVLSWGAYVYISDAAYTGAWEGRFDEGAWVDNRYYIDDAAGPDLPARSGTNKMYGGDEFDYIYQILDETFIEGQTYTLSVWAGQAWSGEARGWWLYFTGEDYENNLIEASGNAPVGSWQQVSVVYTATAADTGKKIGIKMRGSEYVTFEDITLFRISEPMTGDPQVNVYEDTIINFKDFAVLADRFLEEDMFP